ncbi:high affinity cationic amino acid transporter 1-like [Anneissia japonica]|uniref:high affinity cationic amino acid transporter 1-like n=1 Tax=Anneissia japonica TaxID=1529436 RepID=UPI001425669C|nr:high affinity cationic amino acid transporter 1-like [Anneissia japonica]
MIQKQVTSFIASSLFNFVAFNLAAISMLFIVSSDKMNNNCSFGSFGFDGQRWLEIFVNLLSLPALGVVMATNLFIAVHSVYLMSIEGIIPCVFGALYRRTDTPLSSALGVGLVTGILATILSQFRLLQLSAIGTLFTYMLVCISDILMRYRPVQTDDEDTWQDEYSDTEHDEGNGEPAVECHVTGMDTTTIENSNIRFAKIESLGKCKRNVLYADTEKSDESSESDRETDDIDQIVADYKEKLRVASLTQFGSKRKRGRAKEPTSFTLTLVNICLICDMVCQCCIGVILHQYSEQLQQLKTVTFAIFLVTCLLSLIACITIAKQPQLRMDGPSSMILFPWIPLICVFGFIYLMFSLDGATWIVFTLWLSIGKY